MTSSLILFTLMIHKHVGQYCKTCTRLTIECRHGSSSTNFIPSYYYIVGTNWGARTKDKRGKTTIKIYHGGLEQV